MSTDDSVRVGREDLPDPADNVAIVVDRESGQVGFVPLSIRRLGIEAVDGAMYLQDRAQAIQAAQEEILDAIVSLREIGMSWNGLGWCIGMTDKAVKAWYERERGVEA